MTNEAKYWDNVAALKDPMLEMVGTDVDTERHLAKIMEDVKLKKGDEVLEIGCGIGRLIYPLAKTFKKTSFYGYDIAPSLLKLAPKRKNIVYDTHLPWSFAIEKYNFIYSMLVFQHINNQTKQLYIKIASEILHKNGVFRFQFVTGSHQGFNDYNCSNVDIIDWCSASGFLTKIQVDEKYPQWSWCTAKKIGKYESIS